MSSATISAATSGAMSSKFLRPIIDTIAHTWDLGFIAFGGPPTHFKILNDRFVTKLEWLTPQVWLEQFALAQSLPGPASTKLLFCIAVLRSGLIAGLTTFLLWSLPGALGMYGLSLGVHKINEKLPEIVYALLSGLNGATVGIVALAAVELAGKAVTDRVTRICVFFGAAAGLLYNALWYFPVLMVGGGLATVAVDYGWVKAVLNLFKRKKAEERERGVALEEVEVGSGSGSETRDGSGLRRRGDGDEKEETAEERRTREQEEQRTAEQIDNPNIWGWKVGLAIVVFFFASFVAVMIARGVWDDRPTSFAVFANFYLAGTIIFGGGPVVIPLLREYIVSPGFVSSRDFLLGLAIIQAFPGPNFNFAVYLGSLAALSASSSSFPSFAGAILGFLGIFTPGILLSLGILSFWKSLRKRRLVGSVLRGVNASAVGLIFTAVYRLYEIGYVDVDHQRGSSLGREPWWVVVTATSFVGGKWFGLSPPVAIVLGGVMGLIWYGVVKA